MGGVNHRGTETQRRGEEKILELEGGGGIMDENANDPVTYAVIGAAIEVHREMGPGLLESVYQKCMEVELKLRGLAVQPRKPVPVVYKGHIVGDDLIMDLFFP